MTTFVYSESKFLIDTFVKKHLPETEIVTLDFNQLGLMNLHQEVNQISLFAENFYVIENFNLFEKKLEKLIEVDHVYLNEILAAENCLFVLAKPIKSDNNLFLDFRDLIDYHLLVSDEKDIQKQLYQFIRENELKIEPDAMQILLANFPNNPYAVINELKKMSCLTNKEEITKEIVESFSYKTVEANIFQLFELILKKRKKESYKFYLNLLDEGYEPAAIFAIFTSQYKIFYKVKLLQTKGFDFKKIAHLLKINEYRCKMIVQNIRGYRLEELERLYLKIGQVDYEFKAGKQLIEISMPLLLI